jgi:conjugative transposon TraN protein
MKNNIVFLSIIYILAINKIHCQNTNTANPETYQSAHTKHLYTLPIDKIAIKGSYPLGISELKTIHLIFPSAIKEVDAGTADVMAQITEHFNNVLRVKANTNKAFTETNLTVLTEDGGLYSFLTNYSKDPEILNINIGNNLSSDILMSKELGINQFLNSRFQLNEINQSASEIKYLMQKATENKAFIRNTGVVNLSMSAFLKGIYTHQELMYLSFEVNNESYIDFPIDFIKLYIKDKQQLKRMTVQEEELNILDRFPLDNVVKAQTKTIFCLVIPKRTIANDKEFSIEIYEQNGGRHLRFSIDPKLIAKAKTL